jgi:hypothetical protein
MAGYPTLFYKTPQITTGDLTTVNDSAQQNFPLGGFHQTIDSSGRVQLWQYVQFNPTTVATVTSGAPVYYKDTTRTVVTNTVTEAASYAASSFSANGSLAGILAAAVATDTYYIWILKNGYFASIQAPASVVTGDILVCSNTAASAPTDNTFVRVAAGVAPVAGATLGGYVRCLGSVAVGVAPGWVVTE